MYVVIEPIHKQVHGDWSYSGDVHTLVEGKKTKLASFIGATSFNISGMGCILDLNDPEQELYHKIVTEGLEVMQVFKEGGSLQRFRIKDPQKDAAAYMEKRKTKRELERFIEGLQGQRLLNFGLIFDIKGNENVVSMKLLQMAEGTDAQRNALAKYVYHNDRAIVELIYIAQNHEDTNANNKQGLYKNGQGLYYWNSIPIGLGEDQVIAYMKKAENAEIYQALKDTYLGNSFTEVIDLGSPGDGEKADDKKADKKK